MPHKQWLDNDDARRFRDDLLTGALPIRFTIPLTLVANDRPTDWLAVQLDATGRLDVTDVFRVIAAEGMQSQSQAPSRYLFFEGRGYMETTFHISDPVTCSFKFVFTWPEQRDAFDAMLHCEGLMVTTGNVKRLLEVGTLDTGAIGMKLDHAELRQVIASWRTQQ